MAIHIDLHAHTTYSDGAAWQEMVRSAEAAGLTGVGFADHCPIVRDAFGRRERFDFAETYPDRREEFRTGHSDVTLLDGAEVNYDPDSEAEIAAFLSDAEFDYTVGSVHFTGAVSITHPDLSGATREARRAAVAEYVEWQVALIESELFDIVSHLDLVQRSPQLRGLMTAGQYERIAEALSRSRTLPELNAGRLDRMYGRVHPHPDYLELFADRDIPFVIGTDAHAPDQLRRRIAMLEDVLGELPVRIVDCPPGIEETGLNLR